MGQSRGSRRFLVGIAAIGVVMSLLPTPAGAKGQIVCNAAGIVTVIPAPPGPGANQWSIIAKGSCMGDNQGTYFADITAIGGSDTLGACDPDGSLLMQAFELSVTVTLTSTATGQTKVLTETWSAPLTTFPIATPYLISDGGMQSENDFVGAGTILTRIYGNCPPAGAPAGQIAWARTL